MYYIPLAFIILCMLFEFTGKDKKNILFFTTALFLTLILCLRYGQGTDYFGYNALYYSAKHGEMGYTLISQMANHMGISFEVFVGVISLIQMFFLTRAIYLYSPYKIFSLLLVYPTIYLTYFFSAIRQGLVISIFLGLLLKWILEDKWIRVIVAALLLFFIHSSALIIIPVIIIKKMHVKQLWICTCLAGLGAVFIYFVPKDWLSFIKIGSVQYYMKNIEISYLGFAEKVVMFCLVTGLYLKSRNKLKFASKEFVETLYKLYCAGFIIGVLFFPWQLLSSRMGIIYKCLEIILIPVLVKEQDRLKKVCVAVMLGYCLLMTTKNIYSYIDQSPDYSGMNVANYPYFSVFNEREARKTLPTKWKTVLKAKSKYERQNK